MKYKQENIFICYTPLHVIISEKIIQLENIKSYVLIFYVEKDNKKNKYYFNKLAVNASKSFYVKKDNNYITSLKTLFFLYLSLRIYSNSNIFTGNIKTLYSRFIIYLLGFNKLCTFDDGIGNIWGSGYFYDGRVPTFSTRLLAFMKLNFSYSQIYKNISKNYTIYDLPNVMPNSKRINLFNKENVNSELLNNNSTEVVVLLTSTLYENNIISLESEKELYNKIIKKFSVTHIIPHPLEKINKITNLDIKIIDSEMIAEEIILEMKQHYNKIKVVGIYSSAIINLAQIEGVKVVNIHFNFDSSETINQFLSKMDIDTISV